jgi:phosphatidylinositol alpha-1,6-mannosyltransferase
VRVLALVSDAFGGDGGIAQYNRDFLTALADADTVSDVLVLPRHTHRVAEPLPEGLRQLRPNPGRLAYSLAAYRSSRKPPHADVVFCGHIFMSPLAALLARHLRARLWIQTHGVDAWEPRSKTVGMAARTADLLTCVSRFTRDRLLGWLDVEPWRVRVLPNTVGETFTPGPSPAALRERYRLGSRRVLLTISRLCSADRYKGHDRVIAALPALLRAGADVVYLIVGTGDDVPRLEQIAAANGVRDRVIFAGAAATAELADHYRLADVFIMPSIKEGFGIVFLEAAACGIPVIGGNKDGSWDALREGCLGRPIDPSDDQDLTAAVLAALEHGRMRDSTLVDVFRRERFAAHVADLARELSASPRRASMMRASA